MKGKEFLFSFDLIAFLTILLTFYNSVNHSSIAGLVNYITSEWQ